MTLVHEILERHINEVFLECQEKRHITSGDIDPMMSYHLEELTKVLADHITKVLDYQTPQFNMCTTLEVLEGYHCFKRGDIVYTSESTDTHYVVEVNNTLQYIPHEKCRRID